MSRMEADPNNSKAMEAGSSGSSSRNNSTLSNTSYLATNSHDREISKSTKDKEDQRIHVPTCSAEKCLKILFASFLVAIVIVSGYVARITLHLLIWHIGPPFESETSTHLNTFGRLLKPNCSSCRSNNDTTCSRQADATGVDENWIWALYVVIIAPYCLTFLSGLSRICFKTNIGVNCRVLLWVLLIETLHSIGLSIMVFLVLPSFDPATASVIYMTTVIFPPLIDVIDKAFTVCCQAKDNSVDSTNDPNLSSSCCKIPRKTATIKSTIMSITGFLCQVTALILLVFYINSGQLSFYLALSTILVSLKYWENFIFLGKDNFVRTVKHELNKGRTRVTCISNFIKIIVSFLSVIVIYAIRSDNTMKGIRSLFNIGLSSFGEYEIGQNENCERQVPFTICMINIICDYLCYKAAKTACVINCQVLGFTIPMFILPLATTSSFLLLMYYPGVLNISSCDIMFSNWCLTGALNLAENFNLLVCAYVALYVSIILITAHVWKDGHRLGQTARIFVSPFYCGVFMDLSLLQNRRRNDEEYEYIIQESKLNHSKGKQESERKHSKAKTKLYACATMWHEEEFEMCQLLKSIFRLDLWQSANTISIMKGNVNEEDSFDLEAHVFFDDAFKLEKTGKHRDLNDHACTFIEVVKKAGRSVYNESLEIKDYKKERTPYGARLTWTLPGENSLVLHLKNKRKIRHKKRWSQVMYMYYILKWKLKQELKKKLVNSFIGNASDVMKFKKSEMRNLEENSYILALDGDVDFEPEAVLSLVRRMKKSDLVGAACGRIHPIGSGPMVWYQKFEYAISHWLQKATEHVTGCVLCSPGCFSLFRGAAISKPAVLETYTTVSTEPKDYIQYDQGEDRWLCTLLLKQGWKVEYCAESDSYTYAPEGFYAFFKQRRRWTPSTMANILDILLDYKNVTKNENISSLYIIYQALLFGSTLLTPGTIFMIILGAILVGFESIPPWLALILNLIPVILFLLMCLYASSERQLQFAAVLSCIYAVVMLIVLIGVIRDAVEEGFCSTTTIFIMFVAGVFVVSALLHPKEFLCLLPGILYFVAIPSMSMLMFLYSIANLHDVTWGTRETTKESTTKNKKSEIIKNEEKGYFCKFGSFMSCILCPTNDYTKEDLIHNNLLNKIDQISEMNRNSNVTTNKPVSGNATNQELNSQQLPCKSTGEIQSTKQTSQNGSEINGNPNVAISKSQSTDQTSLAENHTNGNRSDIIGESQSAKQTSQTGHETKKDPKDIKGDESQTTEQTSQTEDETNGGTTDKPEKLESIPFSQKVGQPIDSEEITFWKETIENYLKPLKSNKTKDDNNKKKLIELRNKVCLAVYMLNAFLVTIMFSLTQVDSFTESLSIQFDCGGTRTPIVPIAVLFAVVFGFLLLIQFLCMLYHRFSTLVHIAATTNINGSDDLKQQETVRKLVEQLTDKPKFSKSTTDKGRHLLEKNRMMIGAHREQVDNIRMLFLLKIIRRHNLESKYFKKWRSYVKNKTNAKDMKQSCCEGVLACRGSTVSPYQ